jgi:hypothetical protein
MVNEYGYIRVSASEQNEDRQIIELNKIGNKTMLYSCGCKQKIKASQKTCSKSKDLLCFCIDTQYGIGQKTDFYIRNLIMRIFPPRHTTNRYGF